jgi:hypothetical protein
MKRDHDEYQEALQRHAETNKRLALRLDSIRKVCDERHEHGQREGWDKCSISGFCEILRIIDGVVEKLGEK